MSNPDTMIRLRPEDLDFLLEQASGPEGLRDVSGQGNNLAHPLRGTAGQPFVRLTPADYEDGVSAPRRTTADGTPLPNERIVSNAVSDQDHDGDGATEPMPNGSGTNLFLMSFGQFFDHGLDFIRRGGDLYSIPLDTDDVLFRDNPLGFLPLARAAEAPGTGLGSGGAVPRQHVNDTSPFVDQNQTYGSHRAITYYLRESARGADGNLVRDADGLLVKTAHLLSSPDLDRSGFENLPTYRDVLLNNGVSEARLDAAVDTDSWAVLAADPNFIDASEVKDPFTGHPSGQPLLLDIVNTANPTALGFSPATLLSHLVGGDGRLNENIGLTPVHTLFHREHNFQVDRITALVRDRPDAAEWTPDVVFEAAKVIVEAEYQRAVFSEFAEGSLAASLAASSTASAATTPASTPRSQRSSPTRSTALATP